MDRGVIVNIIGVAALLTIDAGSPAGGYSGYSYCCYATATPSGSL